MPVQFAPCRRLTHNAALAKGGSLLSQWFAMLVSKHNVREDLAFGSHLTALKICSKLMTAMMIPLL